MHATRLSPPFPLWHPARAPAVCIVPLSEYLPRGTISGRHLLLKPSAANPVHHLISESQTATDIRLLTCQSCPPKRCRFALLYSHYRSYAQDTGGRTATHPESCAVLLEM